MHRQHFPKITFRKCIEYYEIIHRILFLFRDAGRRSSQNQNINKSVLCADIMDRFARAFVIQAQID